MPKSREELLYSPETLRHILSCESDRLLDEAEWLASQGHRARASNVMLTEHRLDLARQIFDRLVPVGTELPAAGPSPIAGAIDELKFWRAATYAVTQMVLAAGVFEERTKWLASHFPAAAAQFNGAVSAPIEGLRSAVEVLQPLIPQTQPVATA